MAVKKRCIRAAVASVAAATAMSGMLLGAGAAQAVAPDRSDEARAGHPWRPYGVVTAYILNVRQYPSTDSSVRYQLEYGDKVGLDCKVEAQDIHGNPWWYKLRYKERWVSAKYIEKHGYIPLCKDKYPSPLAGGRDAEDAKDAKG